MKKLLHFVRRNIIIALSTRKKIRIPCDFQKQNNYDSLGFTMNIYSDESREKRLAQTSMGLNREMLLTYVANADYPNAMFECLISSVVNKPVFMEDIMVYEGETNNDYEPCKLETFTADENGNVAVTSLAPTTTLIADSGVSMSVEYNKDLNKAFESLVNAIISLGGNV